MALVQVTPPGSLPVTLAEAKAQCRVLDTTHDTLITSLIQSATESIEALTTSRLGIHTLRLELDEFPDGAIDLETYPVNSIVSVLYDDVDNVEQSLVADTDYWESLGGMYPKITPVTSWPETMCGKPASVRIRMQVGYTTDLPPDLKHAVLMRVSEFFNNSSESVEGREIFPTVNSVEALTAYYRRVDL